MAQLKEISPAEARDRQERGEIIIVDVREPGEFENERIRGALNFPLKTFEPATLLGQFPREIVLHCGAGKRSETAAQKLMEAGSGDVTHIAGGLGAWKSAGLPLLRVNSSTGEMEEG